MAGMRNCHACEDKINYPVKHNFVMAEMVVRYREVRDQMKAQESQFNKEQSEVIAR